MDYEAHCKLLEIENQRLKTLLAQAQTQGMQDAIKLMSKEDSPSISELFDCFASLSSKKKRAFLSAKPIAALMFFEWKEKGAEAPL